MALKPKRSSLPVAWHNILNYHHLPEPMTIADFADIARKLGYPYLNWNDWIYDLNTQEIIQSAHDVK